MRFFRNLISKIRFFALVYLHTRGRAAIEKFQLAQIRSLIEYVVRYVPAEAKLFSANTLSPDMIRNVEDLQKIPITTKDFYREKPVEEYTDNSHFRRTLWKKTSGSSGEPFNVLSSDASEDWYFLKFTRYRFLFWDTGLPHIFDTTKIARIDVYGKTADDHLFIPLSDFRSDPEKAIRALAEFKPDIIATFPSIFLELATCIKKQSDLPVLNIRYAVSYGEMLKPHVRRYIENALACEVYDQYGMVEVCGGVAVECRYHDGMHVNSESVIVEVVDSHGHVLPSGKQGIVLVTDLSNRNMPFIRYNTGDHGSMNVDRCRCGLETPRIWIDGRYSAYLTFGGRQIHHLELDGALDGFMNVIMQYQVVKLSEHSAAIRIVPGKAFKGSDPERICREVAKIVGENIALHVETVGHIDATPRGKSKIVADEFATA